MPSQRNEGALAGGVRKGKIDSRVFFPLILLLAAGSNSWGQENPPVGLVGWWAAEGNAYDRVGGNHGMINGGVSFGAGHEGQAFNFDGQEAMVFVPSSDVLNFGTGEFSGALWARMSSHGGILIQKDIPGGPNSSWFLRMMNDGVLWFSVGAETHNDQVVAVQTPLLDGAFHFISWNRRASVLELYIDAQLVGSLFASTGDVSNEYNLLIGCGGIKPGSINLPFHGLIDEVRLFNRALTAEEIRGLYDSTCPTHPSANMSGISVRATLQTVNLGGGRATRSPLAGARIRVFDRNSSAFKTVASRRGQSRQSYYGRIYEADQGRVGSCRTGTSGLTFIGPLPPGEYLTIIRYDDPVWGMTVYAGKRVSRDNFLDTNADGTGDVAGQKIKLIRFMRRGKLLRYWGMPKK